MTFLDNAEVKDFFVPQMFRAYLVLFLEDVRPNLRCVPLARRQMCRRFKALNFNPVPKQRKTRTEVMWK